MLFFFIFSWFCVVGAEILQHQHHRLQQRASLRGNGSQVSGLARATVRASDSAVAVAGKDIWVHHSENKGRSKLIFYDGRSSQFSSRSGDWTDCPHSCTFSSRRSDFSVADAVIWSPDWMNVFDKQPSKRPGTIWVAADSFEVDPAKPFGTDAMWNQTDYVLSHHDRASFWWPFFSYSAGASSYGRPFLVEKTTLVTWFVSNCETTSAREKYATRLRSSLDALYFGERIRGSRQVFAQYGRCNYDHSCPDRSACAARALTSSKFFIAFENSLCDGYITEKTLHGLQGGAVPIVMGGGSQSKRDYAALAPPHSYIDVNDFNSPEDLAMYLQHLDNNDKEYLEYFSWRQSYNIQSDIVSSRKALCRVCSAVHGQNLPPRASRSQVDDARYPARRCHAIPPQRPLLRRALVWLAAIVLVVSVLRAGWLSLPASNSMLVAGLFPGLPLGIWAASWLSCTVVSSRANQIAVGSTPVLIFATQLLFGIAVLLTRCVVNMEGDGLLSNVLSCLPVPLLSLAGVACSLYSSHAAPVETMVVASMCPVLALVMEMWLFGENMSVSAVVGCLVIAVGVVCCVGSFWHSSGSASQTPWGEACLLLGMLAHTSGRCFQRHMFSKRLRQLNPCDVLLAVSLGALAFIALAYPLWSREVPAFSARTRAWLSGEDMVGFAAVVVSCSATLGGSLSAIYLLRGGCASNFLALGAGCHTLTKAAEAVMAGELRATRWHTGLVVFLLGTALCFVSPKTTKQAHQ